jgi:hypothetical protein
MLPLRRAPPRAARTAQRPYTQIRSALLKRAGDFGILLEDVALTHLSFSAEYARAIEFKQVSQQEAERSKYVVLKAEQERRAAVIRAEGESESARLISNATKATGPALIEIRRIEAAKEIAATLSKGRNGAHNEYATARPLASHCHRRPQCPIFLADSRCCSRCQATLEGRGAGLYCEQLGASSQRQRPAEALSAGGRVGLT